MKKKILKKSIIVALLASLCVAPFASCANGNGATLSVGAGLSTTNSSTDPAIKAPKYYEMPNDFRLVAYGTPPSVYVEKDDETGKWGGRQYEYNTQENWQILRDCGFTYAQPIYYETEESQRLLTFQNAEAVNQANPDKEPIKVLLSNYDNDDFSLAEIIKIGGTYAETMARIREKEEGLKNRYDSYIASFTIAGIIIVLINIIGGLCIGCLVNQMPIADAVSKYTVLTIGDGLASQLPSLLMSIAAGIVMTRASAGNDSLGGDLTNQIMSKPTSLFFAALFLGLITVTSPITGLPFLPFLIFTIVLAVAGYSVLVTADVQSQLGQLESVKQNMQDLVNPNKMYERLGVDVLSLPILSKKVNCLLKLLHFVKGLQTN